MSPPGRAATTEESPSPSVIGSTDGCHLPRRITKRIVSEFMDLFPGIPAARALDLARQFIADPDRFSANVRQAGMSRMRQDRLARLMEELPLGVTRTRKVPARRWAVVSS